MVQPTPEVRERHNLKKPEAFSRQQFGQLMVKAHEECNVTIVETACFLEPHASGQMHHNCLVRSDGQYRWKTTAERLFQHHRVSVNFGSNIKTWQEDVVYGKVASEHKGPELLDKAPTQWVPNGAPVPLEEHLPRHMRQPGFVRKVKLTNLAFLDFVRNHSLKTEEEAWALATDLEEKGDKGLMAFLLDNDVATQLAKAHKAVHAKENARRSKLTRVQILEECMQNGACTCASPGKCYTLMKKTLLDNHMEGPFQKDVYDTLVAGRQKERNLCLLGSTNMAKSYLYKPLVLIYKTYERPDGGSHQLEELLGKELIFLNDFEYDEDAKKWCGWGYFKRFLEGGKMPAACPKNRGGNQDFTKDSPVFLTAPQEVALHRGKKKDEGETEQMNSRIKYRRLTYTIPPGEREEVDPCAHCGARVYLEGRSAGAPPAAQPAAQPGAASSSAASAAPQALAPRPTTAAGLVQALKDLKELKDGGLVDSAEFDRLKARLLAGD